MKAPHSSGAAGTSGAPGDEAANPYQSFPDAAGDAAGSTDRAPSERGPLNLDFAATQSPSEPRRIRWLAVLVGYGSDYLLTEIVDRIWWHAVAARVLSGAAEMPSETASLLVISFLGSTSSVVGGFVCGTVAKRAEIQHALVQVTLGFAIFLGQVWSSGGWGLPLWYYVLTIPAVSLATLTGGWLARRRRERRERSGT